MAWNLIKILKLGGVFTFFIWAYICKEKWDTKAIIWINQSKWNTYPQKANRLLHHFLPLLKRKAELCGCKEPLKSFVHHIQRREKQTPRRNDVPVLAVIETGLIKPGFPNSLKWPCSGLSLMLKWLAVPYAGPKPHKMFRARLELPCWREMLTTLSPSHFAG